MFGSTSGQNKPAGGGLFGSTLGVNTQQPSGSLFGGLGQNNQTNQQQQTGGLFGSLGQNNQQNQPQQGGGLFGQSTQNKPQQSGLFGQSTQQSGGLFGGLGQNNQQNQQQQGGGLFGGLGQQNQAQQTGGLFGGANQNQQQQQQPPPPGGMFGGSTQGAFGQTTQQQLPQLAQSNNAMWQPLSAFNPREKTIPEQITSIVEKWDTGNPNCVFKHYFYNKVDENMAPYYRPPPGEDPKDWEDALSKKPGPGYIPVLCVGFAQMGKRIELQQKNLSGFNARLHEINNSLSAMMQKHETETSVRTTDARRKHLVLKQRCLALATKVQVLRNRGYAMGGDEEVLRTKLLALEKSVNDPGLSARGEEIWARMLIVQERARLLKNEIEKTGQEPADILDEEMSRRAKKILEDYNTQLLHLKTEVEKIQKDFVAWEKEQGGPIAPKAKESRNDTQGKSLQFV
ncbi:Nucleoporin complex subunit 54 domain containing protein [Hyaloscypha variabilis]